MPQKYAVQDGNDLTKYVASYAAGVPPEVSYTTIVNSVEEWFATTAAQAVADALGSSRFHVVPSPKHP